MIDDTIHTQVAVVANWLAVTMVNNNTSLTRKQLRKFERSLQNALYDDYCADGWENKNSEFRHLTLTFWNKRIPCIVVAAIEDAKLDVKNVEGALPQCTRIKIWYGRVETQVKHYAGGEWVLHDLLYDRRLSRERCKKMTQEGFSIKGNTSCNLL